MKIRRYFGKNAQEAILKVKMDLGSDAIILNTKKVRQKGITKIFSKPVVEVLAAVDEYNNTAKNKMEPVGTAKEKDKTRLNDLEDKVVGIEDMLQRIFDKIQSPDSQSEAGDNQVKNDENGRSEILHILSERLANNEVAPEIIKKIMGSIESQIRSVKSINECSVLLYNVISKLLGEPETIQLKNNGKATVVIFIGPTGVGKTTTLAKVAASYSLNYNKEVGLITTDTYRIAAVEQLKTYAEILALPLSIAYSANEIREMIDSFSDKDLILIDTAGRSHRNKAQFEEIKTWVEASGADEIYLVLSMTTSNKSCKDIIENYGFLKNYKLIFTKMDEVTTSGLILNVRAMTSKKLSFITNGQNVPDDMEIVDTDKLVKNLLGVLKNE